MTAVVVMPGGSPPSHMRVVAALASEARPTSHTTRAMAGRLLRTWREVGTSLRVIAEVDVGGRVLTVDAGRVMAAGGGT